MSQAGKTSAMRMSCPDCGRSYFARISKDISEKREKHACLCGLVMTYRLMWNDNYGRHVMTITARI